MYFLDTSEEWNHIHNEDLWVYNKLFLNHSLRHLCGPTGVPVPYPGYYIVRPSINLLGMGRFSRIEWIEKDTDHFHPSEFWCELFEGEHLSVDFYQKHSKLVVVGKRKKDNPVYKWDRWHKVNRTVEFPEVLNRIKGDYDWINCEFIGNHLIEVHFRRNPDFRYGNNVAIPVWKGEKVEERPNFTFIEDKDYLREGFYIDTRDSNPVKSSDLTHQEQKMIKKVDKDQNFMRNQWGTEYLSSEYGWEEKVEKQKMLREIANDDLTPKKHDFMIQNELHSKIRNDNDYDDWEYGTEPLYESKNS